MAEKIPNEHADPGPDQDPRDTPKMRRRFTFCAIGMALALLAFWSAPLLPEHRTVAIVSGTSFGSFVVRMLLLIEKEIAE